MGALMSFAGKSTHRRLRDILPTLPIVFGFAEPEAAASIGISVSKFRELVADGRMPKPRQIDGRFVFDVDELRSAFKDLPHAGQAEVDTWADVA
jgi:hypothetical protein